MINTNPKVSIIVPIHNAGNKLEACLDTLIQQTLSEIEIILILDHPTDGSDLIAKKYAVKDERIVIIENRENKHIGESRNIGLKVAKAEFIGFSDHDDYRELNMYEELYNQAKSTCSDIVLGISSTIGEQNKVIHFPQNWDNNNVKEKVIEDLISGGDDISLTPIATNIHPNLYRKSIITNNNIKFVDTLKASPEDRIFQIQCLFFADKVSLYKKPLYYHLIHSGSAVHSSIYQSFSTRINGKIEIYSFLNENNCYPRYESLFLQSTKKEFSNLLINTILETKDCAKIKKAFLQMKKLPFCSKAFKTANYSIDHYRLGGRISRKIIWILMKL